MNRFILIILLSLFLGCSNSSRILPNSKIQQISYDHCWPYSVKIYSVNDIQIDSLFFTYPENSYFPKTKKYKETKWVQFNKFDFPFIREMSYTIQQCEENTELFKQLTKKEDIYFSGIYYNLKLQNGEKIKKYEQFLFLDIKNKRLYIFKDINKVY